MFRCLCAVHLLQKSVQALIHNRSKCTKQISKREEIVVVNNRFGKQLSAPAIESHTLPNKFRRPSENHCSNPRERFAWTYPVFHVKIFELCCITFLPFYWALDVRQITKRTMEMSPCRTRAEEEISEVVVTEKEGKFRQESKE